MLLAAMAVTMGALVFLLWHQNKGLRAETDALRATIEGTQDAQEALDDVQRDGAPSWLRRTFGDQ